MDVTGCSEFRLSVYNAVKRIPKGQVATYGDIAAAAGKPAAAREVGNALHRNPFLGEVPCHRVVNCEGGAAAHFAFGGAGEQRRMLEAEGVTFRKNGRVNMELHRVDREVINGNE